MVKAAIKTDHSLQMLIQDFPNREHQYYWYKNEGTNPLFGQKLFHNQKLLIRNIWKILSARPGLSNFMAFRTRVSL